MASTSAAPAGTHQGNPRNVGSDKLMGLMIDQDLIPRLLNLIKMRKYNPSALWTLDNVLYNNETGKARENAVEIAWEKGALEILIGILRPSYSSGSFFFTDRASSKNVNAAIHCLRIMILNHKSNPKKKPEWPDMENMLRSMSEIEIKSNDEIEKAIYQDIKGVATDIIRWRKAPLPEDVIGDMGRKLPELVKSIKEDKTNFYELWTLDNVLYDDKAERVRMDAVEIAQKEGVVEILLENLRAGYFPKIPDKYSLEPFTSATIHCLRIMVLNNPKSRREMVESENMWDIIKSLAAHWEADEHIKGAAEHILKEVKEFQNTSQL